MAHETSDATFQRDVLESDRPVLVDFWASWCFPCRMVAPIIEQVQDSMGDSVKVYKVNVDENPRTSSDYNIRGIPTVLLFKNGNVEKEFVGVRPAAVYLNALEQIREPVGHS